MTTIVDGTTGITFPSTIGGTSAVQQYSSKVLQIVQGTYSTQTSMTGTTATATGLTATITPTSATSKILIKVYIPAYNASASTNAYYIIYRNGSSLQQLAYYQTSDTGSNPLIVPYNAIYYDSPATTSATTYAIYAVGVTGGTHYWAFGNLQCSITLMEIAG